MTRWRLLRLLPWLGLGALGAWLLTAPPRGVAFAPAPRGKDWGKEFKNSVGMKLVRIPAGKFKMGSPASEVGRLPDEGPVHEVEITKPFYLGAFEVTQAEYDKVMGKNPSHFSPTGARALEVKGVDTKKLPVEGMTWEQAEEFCKRLSALPAEKRAGRVYRLPSEAEWEYACRAGTATAFHFGDELLPAQANFVTGWQLRRPAPVGSYKPNAFGLYDLHGNVQELCADWYGYAYYRTSPGKDPTGPATGKARVVRGGSWVNVDGNCRAAGRAAVYPKGRECYIGFRAACVPATGK